MNTSKTNIILVFVAILLVIGVIFIAHNTISNKKSLNIPNLAAVSSSVSSIATSSVICTQDTDNTSTDESNSYYVQGTVSFDDGSSVQDYCATDLDSSGRTLMEYACNNSVPSAHIVTCGSTNNSCSAGRCMIKSTTLSGVALPGGAVKLSWPSFIILSGSNDGYYVYRNNNKIADVATTTYLDSGLNFSTHYSYNIVAHVGSSGSSTLSQVSDMGSPFGITTLPPAVLTTNLARVPSGGVAVLTWNTVGASSCNLSASNAYGVSAPALDSNVNWVTGSTTTGILTVVGTYTYSLSCVGSNGPATSTVSVNVFTAAVPTITSSLKIGTNSNQLLLTVPMSVNNNASAYIVDHSDVYRSNSPSVLGTLITSIAKASVSSGATSTIYNDSGLIIGKKYCYTVKSTVTNFGQLVSSPVCNTMTAPKLSVPSITGVYFIASGIGTEVDWASSTILNGTIPTGYFIFKTGATVALATIPSPTLLANFSGLKLSTKYCYQVQAYQLVNTTTYRSARSASVCVTLPATVGSASRQSLPIAVAMNTAPVPTVTISTNPASIPSGGSGMIVWSSTDSTSCLISGDLTSDEPVSGSISTGNITSSQTYTMTCTGDGGSASASATANVASTQVAAPIVTTLDLSTQFPNQVTNFCDIPLVRTYTVSPFPFDVTVTAQTSVMGNDTLQINGQNIGTISQNTYCVGAPRNAMNAIPAGTVITTIPAYTPIVITNTDDVGGGTQATGVLMFTQI